MLTSYFSYNYLENDKAEGRSEKEGSLRATPLAVADVEQARDDELTRQCSTNSSAIAGVTTVACIKGCIEMLKSKYNFLNAIAATKPTRKKYYAELIAKYHAAIINKDAQFKKSITDELTGSQFLCEGIANPVKKAEELKHLFYSLTDDAKEPFHNAKYLIDVPLDDADRNLMDESASDEAFWGQIGATATPIQPQLDEGSLTLDASVNVDTPSLANAMRRHLRLEDTPK